LFNIFSKVKGRGRNGKTVNRGCMKLAFGSEEGVKGARGGDGGLGSSGS